MMELTRSRTSCKGDVRNVDYSQPMEERWERLFADLESQNAEAPDEEEISALVEAERVSVPIAERLTATIGREVTVRTTGGLTSIGQLADAGEGWLLLSEGRSWRLVPLARVAAVGPLAPPRPSGRALSFAGILRRLVGQQVAIDAGGVSAGRLQFVGADHLDLGDERGGSMTVPLTAIESVRLGPDAFGERP